jgi:hypothetical protein
MEGSMRRPLIATPLVLLACYFTAPVSASEGRGKLDELSPVIRRLIPLAVDQGRLRLDRESWERPAEDVMEEASRPRQVRKFRRAFGDDEGTGVDAIFNKLQNAAGANSTSHSGGDNSRSIEFSGNGLWGRLRVSGPSIRIELQEDETGRRLDIHETDGSLQMVLMGPDGEPIIVLLQNRAGRFRIAHVAGDTPFSASSPSFLDFYRVHRGYVEQKLIPLLTGLGIGAFPSTDSPAVRLSVREHLRPIQGAEREEIERFILQLNDADHAKREEATKRLIERGARHASRLDAARKAADLPPESATRLDRVITEIQRQRRIDALAESLGLADDTPYLIRLLQEAPEPERPSIEKALERLTGQRLGANPAAWQTWLDAKKPSDGASRLSPNK